MAVIQSEFSFSASPKWKGIFEATETSRNGSSVTFKIVAKLKLDGTSSSTFYGYAVNWRATLNGVSSGLLKVKDASPRWYGGEAYRTFTTTLTTSVGASGGTVPLKIEVLASGGGNVSLSKTYNVSYSTWNTPPTMSGSLALSPSGTIAENTSTIKLSWTKASDSNNNLSGYQIYRYVNGSHNATIDVGASATSYSDTVSGFGQGTKIYYKIWAKDSYGEWSGALTSGTITKNTITGASVSITSGTIKYGSTAITGTYSGASNTNGNTSFTYTVSSDNIKVYNGTVSATPFTLTIVRSGETAPSTPYVLFNDIKSFASGGSNWQRTATFKLTTKNAYGSTVTKTNTVAIDLRTNPKAPTTVTISGKTPLTDGRSYYICGKSTMAVSWSGASDHLGGSLTYDVQTKLDTGSYTTVKSGLTATNTTVTLPTVTAEKDFYIRVIAKTSYGNTAYKDASVEKIHYYNAPTVEFKNLNRTAEGMSVEVITATNTSIPTVGWTKRAYSGVMSGDLTTSPQTLSKSGLDGGTAYTLKATIQDDTGLSSEVSKTLNIPVYTPILSVREKGVGVNAIPDGTAKLVVNGGANIKGGLKIDSKSLIDLVYPVGAIYMSVNSTNPSSLFGGTWVAWGSGRVPVGINTGETEFNTVEKTGGAKTHTLTVAQMPSHTHVQNAHTHTQNAHTHTQNAHTHTQNAHSHGVRYRGYSGVSASTSGHVLLRRNATDDPYDGTDGDSALSTTATNQSTTATNNNTTATNQNTTATNQNTGGGGSHNNLQPYITCYMWKRTA